MTRTAATETAGVLHPETQSRWQISSDLAVECATCGFEPSAGNGALHNPCPKCGASTWRPFIRPQVLSDGEPRAEA